MSCSSLPRRRNRSAEVSAVASVSAVCFDTTAGPLDYFDHTAPSRVWEQFVFSAIGWMVAAFAFDWWIFAASAGVSGYQGSACATGERFAP
jgi:hypothetical protein